MVGLEKTERAGITLFGDARLVRRVVPILTSTHRPRPRMTGSNRILPLPVAPKLAWRRRAGRVARVGVGAACLMVAAATRAADPAEVQRGLLAGNYAAVIKQASGELREGAGNSEWSMLLVRALLTVGRYAEADAAMKDALARDARSIRLRWLARDVAFANGRPEEAAARVDEVRRAVRDSIWMYKAPADLVVFGRAALMLGADPKEVLDKVYATAQKADQKLRVGSRQPIRKKFRHRREALHADRPLVHVPDPLFGQPAALVHRPVDLALDHDVGVAGVRRRHGRPGDVPADTGVGRKLLGNDMAMDVDGAQFGHGVS